MTDIIRGASVGHSKPPIYTPFAAPQSDKFKYPSTKIDSSQFTSPHPQNGYSVSANRNYQSAAPLRQSTSGRQQIPGQVSGPQFSVQGRDWGNQGPTHNDDEGRRSDIRSDPGCVGGSGSNFNPNVSSRQFEHPAQFRIDAKPSDLSTGCHGNGRSNFHSKAVANGYTVTKNYYPAHHDVRDMNNGYSGRHGNSEFNDVSYRSYYDVGQISSDGVRDVRLPADVIAGRDGYLHTKRQPIPVQTSKQFTIESQSSQKPPTERTIRLSQGGKVQAGNSGNDFHQKFPKENCSGYPNLYIRNAHYEGKRIGETSNDGMPSGDLPIQMLVEPPRRRTWSPPEPWGVVGEGQRRARGQEAWGASRRYHSSDQLDNLEAENLYESLDDDINSPPKITPFSGQLSGVKDGGRLIRPIPCRPSMLPPPRSRPRPLPQPLGYGKEITKSDEDPIRDRTIPTNQAPSDLSSNLTGIPSVSPLKGSVTSPQVSEGRAIQFNRLNSREFQPAERGMRTNNSSMGDYVAAQNSSHIIPNTINQNGLPNSKSNQELGKLARPQLIVGLRHTNMPSNIAGHAPFSRAHEMSGLGQSSRVSDAANLGQLSRSHNLSGPGQSARLSERMRAGLVSRPKDVTSQERVRVPSSERIYETISSVEGRSSCLDLQEQSRGTQPIGQALGTVRESLESTTETGQRWACGSSNSRQGPPPPPPPARKAQPRRSSDEGYGSREGTQQRGPLGGGRRQGSDLSATSLQGDQSLENATLSSSGSSSENTSLNRSSNSTCFSPAALAPTTENNFVIKRSISDDKPPSALRVSSAELINNPELRNRGSAFASNWRTSKSVAGSEYKVISADKNESSSSVVNNGFSRLGDSVGKMSAAGIFEKGMRRNSSEEFLATGVCDVGNSTSGFSNDESCNSRNLNIENLNKGISKKFSYSARNLHMNSSESASNDWKYPDTSGYAENSLSVHPTMTESKSCRDLRDIHDRKEMEVEHPVPSLTSGHLPAAQKRRGSASAIIHKLRASKDCSTDGAKDLKQPGSGQVTNGTGKAGCRSFVVIQTPSPSDSGVGELEAVIKEKEMEIQRIRETMENNETAIMQVLEEKKQAWEEELTNREHSWESRLRLQQQKSFKAEQCLLMQIFKVQQDNKNLQQRLDAARTEISELVTRLESGEEDFSAERSMNVHLSKQLEEVLHKVKVMEDEIRIRDSELVSTRLKMKDAEVEYNHRTSIQTNSKSDSINSSHYDQSPTAMQNGLNQSDDSKHLPNNFIGCDETGAVTQTRLTPLSLEEMRAEFERERARWLAEKSKVVEYQKQLQLNYVQMSRRNRQLETELQQLTLELEAKEAESFSEGSLVSGSAAAAGEQGRQGPRQKVDVSIVPSSC